MIELSNIQIPLRQQQTLTIDALTMQTNQSWAFLGTNGSGKSALAAFFSGELNASQGQRQGLQTCKVNTVSFEEQQRLIDRERVRHASHWRPIALF